MSGPQDDPLAQVNDALGGRPEAALNLIHRNNSPKPITMRVSRGLVHVFRTVLYSPLRVARYRWLIVAIVRIDYPLRVYLLKGVYDGKTT